MIARGKPGGTRGGLPVLSLAPWHAAVEAILTRHGQRPAALIQILHEIQGELRHVPPDAVPAIAHALNLSRAEVHGVVSFYHDFRDNPAGRHVLKICRAESCQAVGSDELVAHAKSTLGIDDHGTTNDGAVTLEPVYCLGNCALSPAIMIDNDVFGRITAARLDLLLDTLRRDSTTTDPENAQRTQR
jgi:formate dehydrogenase subunit gamma